MNAVAQMLQYIRGIKVDNGEKKRASKVVEVEKKEGDMWSFLFGGIFVEI